MGDPGIGGYLGIASATIIVTYVLVPVLMRIAVRFDLLDRPGGYKEQPDAVPYLGGAAIAFAVIAGLAVAGLARPPTGTGAELWTILGVAAGIAVVGLVDDLRGLGPTPKLLAVGLAAAILWAGGTRIAAFDVEVVNLVVTVLWIAGITNAMNLMDNMDGLSAGVAAIAALTFFGLAATNGQYLVASLGLAVAGAAVGFLPRNRHPATVYMGDAGSLFLGLMLAVLGIRLRFPDVPNAISVLIPIAVLAVPIMDTTVVVVTRLAAGRPVARGARDHLSHRLTTVGVSVPAAVGLIYGAVVASAWLAVVLSRLTDVVTAWALAGLALSVASVVAVLLAGVAVHGEDRRYLQYLAPGETDDAGRRDDVPA